jgi:hypothetical protein
LGSAFESFNAISERPYEGAGASGRILFVAPNHATVHVAGRLREPVDLGKTRAVRKLLETTDRDFALLAHADGIYGFGRVDTELVTDVFEIEITGHAQWELRNSNTTLIRVTYGDVSLPHPMFQRDAVEESLNRVFGGSADLYVLLGLISAATNARHGTTLVISSGAEAESERLAGSATRLSPQQLTPELLDRYATMDGAVLVSPAGICYAVGVILDGQANDRGDPGRGARYNSAARYEAASTHGTVIAVVSEDGGVTMVPGLRRRVRRQAVEDAVVALEQSLTVDSRGAFSEAHEGVRSYAFYLSEEQCHRVNEAIGAERAEREAEGGLVIVREHLSTSAEMDDSYFLD